MLLTQVPTINLLLVLPKEISCINHIYPLHCMTKQELKDLKETEILE